MNTFLDKIASEIAKQFGNEIADVVVVLPNKRSKVFLTQALKHQLKNTFFAPEIVSIEELVEQISEMRILNSVELLFEFYKIYEQVSQKEKQDFEQFAPWAKVLLKDFSDIDAYLCEPDKVLQYLKDIKEVEHWSLSEKKTKLIEKHLKFWGLLPQYYHAFKEHLLSKDKAYQGLAYKKAVEKLGDFTQKNNCKNFVFAGFNALSVSEEKIIQHFLAFANTRIFWDTDSVFLQDKHHQAGRFLRKTKQNWSYYKTQPFHWVFDEFSQAKNIQVIGTPKAVGQAKIIGKIIENQLQKNPENLSKTVIILPEKNLLTSVLYSLPASVTDLNITLGYPSKNNPVQFLINRLFKMHTFAKSKSENSYTFYYKDVLEVLSHPLAEPFLDSETVVNIIKSNNFTFISHQKLFDLQPQKNPFFHLIFDKWNENPLEILERISAVLLYLKDRLNQKTDTDRITKTFVFEIFKVINQLKNHFSNSTATFSVAALYGIYKQVVDVAEVAFEGEPLSGLQIMGILESRNLDFENVIIASMNEGKFPLGKSQNSFIPLDVKREYGLPSYRERDAVYTYHFYRLLQRAKNVFLIYNTDNDSFDGGEKSRFITQLEVEKQPNHQLIHQMYQAVLPNTALSEMVVEKSETVMNRLREIAQKGFSPSALSTYIRNPLDFYYQRILKISEIEEVEETIEANTLGNIIHNTLEELYTPFLNRYLSEKDIEVIESRADEVLLNHFRTEFKEGEIKKGKNLLAFEASKRSIFNFLKQEKDRIIEGDSVKILHLEEAFEQTIESEKLPFPVKIAGLIDRIEIRNNVLRILDYKTGKVEAKNLTLSDWGDFLSDESKNKIIQLLCYAYMVENQTDLPIEAGIISFKNLKSGFLPFRFKTDTKEEITTFTPEIKEQFLAETISLLAEILDDKIPFLNKKI
ncbi:MAG: PD-(D/E)XK nuclease family protein [Flavobacteriaceae bacterium]